MTQIRKLFTAKCGPAVAFIVLVLLSNTAAATGVVVDGKLWRQLSDTSDFRLRWFDISTVCPSGGGLCNGTKAFLKSDGSGIRTIDFSNWYWATDTDVIDLFGAYIPGYAGGNKGEAASTWASHFVTDFTPTTNDNFGRYVRGWSATEDPGQATFAFNPSLADLHLDEHQDIAFSDSKLHKTTTTLSTGIWLYQPVPLPPGLFLLGVGLVGVLRLARTR